MENIENTNNFFIKDNYLCQKHNSTLCIDLDDLYHIFYHKKKVTLYFVRKKNHITYSESDAKVMYEIVLSHFFTSSCTKFDYYCIFIHYRKKQWYCDDYRDNKSEIPYYVWKPCGTKKSVYFLPKDKSKFDSKNRKVFIKYDGQHEIIISYDDERS